MPWACDRCRTLHTQNPDECRNCGHRIFDPESAAAGSSSRAVRNTVRATLLAPFSLLRRYLLPVFAFLLVFGGVAYLLGLVP